MMNNKRLLSIFTQIKQVLSYCPCDIHKYVMNIVLILLRVEITPNVYGFTIKTFNNVLTYGIGSEYSILEPYESNNKVIKLYTCTIQNVDTITLFKSGDESRCVYALLKNGKFLISECCADRSVWSTHDTSDIYTNKLVEMKINVEGKISHFAHIFNACFVMIDNKLYIWSKFINNNVANPEQIVFPNNEFPVDIGCTECHTLVLTNEGNVYKFYAKTMRLGKISMCDKVKSICCSKWISFILTNDEVLYILDMFSHVTGPIKIPYSVIKICCVNDKIYFTTKSGELFVTDMKTSFYHLIKSNDVVDIKTDGNIVLFVTGYGIFEYRNIFEDMTLNNSFKIMDL